MKPGRRLLIEMKLFRKKNQVNLNRLIQIVAYLKNQNVGKDFYLTINLPVSNFRFGSISLKK
jgi:hypothetical protein